MLLLVACERGQVASEAPQQALVRPPLHWGESPDSAPSTAKGFALLKETKLFTVTVIWYCCFMLLCYIPKLPSPYDSFESCRSMCWLVHGSCDVLRCEKASRRSRICMPLKSWQYVKDAHREKALNKQDALYVLSASSWWSQYRNTAFHPESSHRDTLYFIQTNTTYILTHPILLQDVSMKIICTQRATVVAMPLSPSEAFDVDLPHLVAAVPSPGIHWQELSYIWLCRKSLQEIQPVLLYCKCKKNTMYCSTIQFQKFTDMICLPQPPQLRQHHWSLPAPFPRFRQLAPAPDSSYN